MSVAIGQQNVRRRASLGLIFCLYLLIYSVPGLAQKPAVTIRNADTSLVDGVWYATALIDYELSDEAFEALNNGITLAFELQIRLKEVRRFWPDSEMASLTQRMELSYQPLSERYVVRYMNSGKQKSFATLFSVLTAMGRIDNLPVIDASLLEPEETYLAEMRVVLDQSVLPGPLRMFTFWDRGFQHESDWYQWKLSN